MISFKGIKIRTLAMLVMLAVAVPLAVIASFAEYIFYRAELNRHIDGELQIAATFAKELLEDDYHDRIENKNSVTHTEYDRIVNRFNELCFELELEYIWSLMTYGEQLVFTCSTSPDKNLHDHSHPEFFEVHSNPEFYEKALKTMEPQFLNIFDKWGDTRAVLIPYYDSRDRKHLFGASKKLRNIEAITPYILRNTLITSAIFLIPGLFFSLMASRWLTRPIARLAKTAEQIGSGDYNQKSDFTGIYEIKIVSEQLNTMSNSIQRHLKASENSLKELREFEAIVNNSPVIAFSLDIQNDFRTLFISENISMAGYRSEDFISGKITWEQIVPENQFQQLYAEYEIAISEEKSTFVVSNTKLIWATGEIREQKNWYQIIHDETGTPIKLQGMSLDITEQVRAQEQEALYLSQLNTSHQELLEFHDIVIGSNSFTYRFGLSDETPTLHVSSNISITGYEAEEFTMENRRWTDLIPEDDYSMLEIRAAEALEQGIESYRVEYRMKWKNGEMHWYMGYNNVLRDEQGMPTVIQGVANDITELRMAHDRDLQYQNKLKTLALDLEKAEDNERRRLAYMLHDDIGQMLAGLNMKFIALEETSDRDRIHVLTDQVDELLTHIMQATKTLTWEISPTSLYGSDMAEGLKHMAQELKKYFDLHISIETAGLRVELDPESSSFIFRCSKELLVNIAKHAGVKHAEVGISQYGNKVHLVVSDQGKGFETRILDQSTPPGFGLFSIRERIEYMGGSLHIESAPNKGTKVMLILPMNLDALI